MPRIVQITVAVASTAGALLIVTNRSVLTAGVTIALALIPAAALVGMALVIGDWALLGRALVRWSICGCHFVHILGLDSNSNLAVLQLRDRWIMVGDDGGQAMAEQLDWHGRKRPSARWHL